MLKQPALTDLQSARQEAQFMHLAILLYIRRPSPRRIAVGVEDWAFAARTEADSLLTGQIDRFFVGHPESPPKHGRGIDCGSIQPAEEGCCSTGDLMFLGGGLLPMACSAQFQPPTKDSGAGKCGPGCCRETKLCCCLGVYPRDSRSDLSRLPVPST